MTSVDNPAGRLHKLLEQGMKEEQNQRVHSVWAKLLKIDPPQNTALLLKRLGKVYALPSQIAEQVGKYLTNPDLHLKWRPNVERALSDCHFSAKWGQVIGHIDAYTLLSLEHCDDQLSRHSKEASIDDQQLQKVGSMVVELMEEVKRDDIDPAISTYILDRLEEINEAIDELLLTGTSGVRRTLETSVGSIATQVYIFMPQASEKEKSHLRTFFKTLTALTAVINITLGAPQLPAAIQQLALVEAPQTAQTEQLNKDDSVIDGEIVSSDEPSGVPAPGSD